VSFVKGKPADKNSKKLILGGIKELLGLSPLSQVQEIPSENLWPECGVPCGNVRMCSWGGLKEDSVINGPAA
jgi:hypothetical protein